MEPNDLGTFSGSRALQNDALEIRIEGDSLKTSLKMIHGTVEMGTEPNTLECGASGVILTLAD